MPNFTTPIPPKLTGDTAADVGTLKRWGTALVDELTYLFNNLDSGNVIEAASVKAENIETKNAKISNAQIGALSADKLVAGSVDTNRVTVSDSGGKMSISGSQIVISDSNRERFVAAYDKDSDKFSFVLYNSLGEATVEINNSGDAMFKGTVASSRILSSDIESTEIFSSTIVGTDKESYNNISGNVFAEIDKTGIKVMQDADGARKQKIGMTVSNEGDAYLVLGAGNGSGQHKINGVVYTTGAFNIEKNAAYAKVGFVGLKPNIIFYEDSQELHLSGKKVIINDIDVADKISKAESSIAELKAKVDAMTASGGNI